MIFSQCVWLCFISVVFHLSSSPTLSLFPLLNGPERLSEQRSTPSLHHAVFYALFLSVFAPCRYSVPTYLFPRIQFLPGHIGHSEAKRRPCSAAQHGVFGVQMQVDKRAQKLCVCVCVCVYYAWNEECSHAHMYRRDREWQPSTDVLPPKNGSWVFSDGFMYSWEQHNA